MSICNFCLSQQVIVDITTSSWCNPVVVTLGMCRRSISGDIESVLSSGESQKTLGMDKMTSSTKPEVHNFSHCHQTRIQPRPQVIYTELECGSMSNVMVALPNVVGQPNEDISDCKVLTDVAKATKFWPNAQKYHKNGHNFSCIRAIHTEFVF